MMADDLSDWTRWFLLDDGAVGLVLREEGGCYPRKRLDGREDGESSFFLAFV